MNVHFNLQYKKAKSIFEENPLIIVDYILENEMNEVLAIDNEDLIKMFKTLDVQEVYRIRQDFWKKESSQNPDTVLRILKELILKNKENSFDLKIKKTLN